MFDALLLSPLTSFLSTLVKAPFATGCSFSSTAPELAVSRRWFAVSFVCCLLCPRPSPIPITYRSPSGPSFAAIRLSSDGDLSLPQNRVWVISISSKQQSPTLSAHTHKLARYRASPPSQCR